MSCGGMVFHQSGGKGKRFPEPTRTRLMHEVFPRFLFLRAIPTRGLISPIFIRTCSDCWEFLVVVPWWFLAPHTTRIVQGHGKLVTIETLFSLTFRVYCLLFLLLFFLIDQPPAPTRHSSSFFLLFLFLPPVPLLCYQHDKNRNSCYHESHITALHVQ